MGDGAEGSARGVRVSRTAVSHTLAALTPVLVVAAVCALWLDGLALDTDAYVERVSPLWQEPAVREKAAEEISEHFINRIQPGSALRAFFPEVPSVLAGLLAAQVEPVVSYTVRGAVAEYVASPGFEQAWVEVNAITHQSIVEQLLSDDRDAADDIVVELDLAELGGAALGQWPALADPGEDGTRSTSVRSLQILDSGELPLARRLVRVMHGRGPLLTVLSLVCAAAAVALSENRMRVCGVLFVGLAVGFAAMLTSISLVSDMLVVRLAGWHLSEASATVLVETVTLPLRRVGVVGTLGAVVLAVVTLVPRRTAES